MPNTTQNNATAQPIVPFRADPVYSFFPIGAVVPYTGKVDAPDRRILADAGWLLCNGDPISRTRFARLYQVIGDIHGRGDATETFNLPDYRGRFLRGVDQGVGRDPEASKRDPAAPGGLNGDAVGSVQGHSVGAHFHYSQQMVADNNIDGVDSATTHSGEHHNERKPTELSDGTETRPINAYVHWLILAGKPVN